MDISHETPRKPSPLLTLIALAIVVRSRPDWIRVQIQQAAAELGFRPGHISRLTTRAVGAMEELLARLTRRGRPTRDTGQDLERELMLRSRLLEVCVGLLREVNAPPRVVREIALGAWERLKDAPGMTQQWFCDNLGIASRTLRDWISNPRPRKTAEPSATAPRRRRKRGPRRGRFGFDVTIPGLQMAADTTDIKVLGVGLKLMAAQDVGGRDIDLLEAVVIEPQESAQQIAQMFSEALSGRPGTQMISDQGTPYMAASTRQALEDLGAQHAPQREANPTAKATIERAFRTVQELSEPLFALSDRVAEMFPSLRTPELAAALARRVVYCLLQAYQHGARAARQACAARAGVDVDELVRRAELSRQRAVATDRSRRLLLEHIHRIYDIGRPLHRFIHDLYNYPLDVLKEAERAFIRQVHRDDIRDRASYFCALVRSAYKQWVQRRDRDERERQERRQRDEQSRIAQEQARIRKDDPIAYLFEAFDWLSLQWNPGSRSLLFAGEGPALGMLRAALRGVHNRYGSTAFDIANGVKSQWLTSRQTADAAALSEIESVFHREMAAIPIVPARGAMPPKDLIGSLQCQA
jgi:transposase InsO family protein